MLSYCLFKIVSYSNSFLWPTNPVMLYDKFWSFAWYLHMPYQRKKSTKKMVVFNKIIDDSIYRISPYIETPKAYRTSNLRQINLLSLFPFKLWASIFIDKDIHNDISYRRITRIHLFHVALVRNQKLLPNWSIHYVVGIFTFKNHEMYCMVKIYVTFASI